MDGAVPLSRQQEEGRAGPGCKAVPWGPSEPGGSPSSRVICHLSRTVQAPIFQGSGIPACHLHPRAGWITPEFPITEQRLYFQPWLP